MRALHRKLLRDLRRLWSQVLSIAALVGCGVLSVLSMRSTLHSIEAARSAYYDRYRFADVFASLERAPDALAARIAAIPCVAVVQTRVVARVALDVPGLDEPATGHLVSVPGHGEPPLNGLHVRRGRRVAPGRADEVVVSEGFAAANQLEPGATLGAVINGRWQRLRVVGIAVSPEFVYEEAAAGFFVDVRRFGVMWMARDALAAARDMEGAFNDVALRLSPGAREAEVIAALDRLIEPYGGRGAVGRADQASHSVLSDEINQLAVLARVFPLFFVGVAAFLLNVVLGRLVSTERDQIGTLKAFGYSDLAVGLHYLGFAMVAIAAGTLLGVASGAYFGAQITDLYQRVFRIPDFGFRVAWADAAGGVAVSGGAALIGALGAVRAAVRMPPAEALRPEAPARFRPLMVERLGVAHLLPSSARMLFRNLERRPLRTLSSVVGIALSGAVLLTGLYPYDSMDWVMEVHFRRAAREDLTVSLHAPRPAAAVRHELASVVGVTAVEPFRAVPVRLRNGHRTRTAAIQGMDDRPDALRRIVDMRGEARPVPPAGLVLGASLAQALGAGRGDTLAVELLERGGERRTAVVVALVEEMIGANAYMERRALNRLAREDDLASGAYLTVERGARTEVFRRLKRTPSVAGASSRQALIDTFRRQMAEGVMITLGLVITSACLITLAVVYNGARIALSERGRELASLRVLGFTRGEATELLLGEQAIITALGIPLSFAAGYGFAWILSKGMAAERHRFPVTLDASSYLITAGIIAAAAVLAGLALTRRVNRLDLIAVLKTRE